MKIVHVVSGIGGGAGIAALRLHRALRNIDGVESYILQKADTLPEYEQENIYTLYETKNLFYRIKRKLGLTPEKKQEKILPTFPKHYEYEIATFPTTSYRIEKHPLIQEADIIHLHWVGNFLNYPSFFKKVKKTVVWTLHDRNPFSGIFHTQTDLINNPHFLELNKKIENDKSKYLSKACNLVIITPSQWLSQHSQHSKVLGQFQHMVIPNALDVTDISHTEARGKLNVNRQKTFLFIAHSIDIPRRGFFLMKDALKLINKNLLNFNLITVGGNKIDIDIDSINHVHYPSTNDVNLLNTLYSASDIQLLPTMEDNLPNVMLESFANGTPVISFANGGMAEHVITGKNGILVETIGVEPLKNAIESFLNNEYSFDRDAIKQYAVEHFSSNLIVQQHLDLYKKLI